MTTGATRLIAFLYFAQALFLASTFRNSVAVVAATVFAAMIVYARLRRPVDDDPTARPTGLNRLLRTLGLIVLFTSIIGITTMWRFGNQLGESINWVYVGSDVLAHVAILCSLTVWTLRPRRGHVSMLPLGLIVILLCVAAGGASLSLAGQTSVALAACVGFALASQIILSTKRGNVGSFVVGDRGGKGKPSWTGPMISLLTLSILMMATSAIANATTHLLPSLQERLQRQLEASFNPVADDSMVGGTRYVRGSKLGGIRRHLLADPQAIALRIRAKVAPGYLRGSVFDRYYLRRWGASGSGRYRQFDGVASLKDRRLEPSSEGRVKLQASTARLQRFSLTDTVSNQEVALQIQNDPLKGQVIFTPLNTRWIEAHSQEIVVSTHNNVVFGIDVSKPYVAGVGLQSEREPMDSERREVLLDVHESLAAETKGFADQICARASTPRAKGLAISQFFQSQFTYSLTSTPAPRGVDPVLHFLRQRHSAHCEYFASASVLLLRSAGVPARYVTGYVSNEYDDEMQYWVARHRDAHAWAEAYDDASGRWFPVESTPGRRYLSIEEDLNGDAGDSFFDVFGNDDDEERVTIISRAIGWVMAMRATDPLMLLFRLAQLPLFCVLAFLLWSKYLRPSQSEVDPIDRQSRKMLRHVDRRLRKHALVRETGETLYQFADRIEARRSDAASQLRQEAQTMLMQTAQWYRQYANARYQGQLPTPLA